MSEQRAKRLDSVKLESDAAIEAIDVAARCAQINPKHYVSDTQDLQRAARNSGATYYFRLISEMEGMLFRHLKDHFPSFGFADDDGATALVNHCRHRLNPARNDSLPNDLADEVLESIRWRNYLVHGQRGDPPLRVPFVTAHRRIHDLVLLLPKIKGSHG
jgi:hypothetical protein